MMKLMVWLGYLFKSERAAVDYRPQVGLVVTDMYLSIAEMQPRDKGMQIINYNLQKSVKRHVDSGHYTCHCSNIYGTANWTISVEGTIFFQLFHPFMNIFLF